MKILSIILSVSIGYFLPNYSVNSLLIFVLLILFSFILGWVCPDMMNHNSLFSKEDKNKVTVKSKISWYRPNTQSLWIGIIFCVAAITNFLKVILLSHALNQLSIIIFVFGIGAIIKIYDFKPKLDNPVPKKK